MPGAFVRPRFRAWPDAMVVLGVMLALLYLALLALMPMMPPLG